MTVPAATWNLIRQLAADGTTVMLTTHYMDEVEALADRVAVLSGAQIVAAGTPVSIGGRDSGAVTIRFALPDGVMPIVERTATFNHHRPLIQALLRHAPARRILWPARG